MNRCSALFCIVWTVACRPTSEPAPLAPSGDGAGSPASTPSPTEPSPTPAAEDDAGPPNMDAICETYAKGYCEPGDASPAAINPGLREMIAVDCKKRLLEHADPVEVEHCVETTKECGAMGKCLE